MKSPCLLPVLFVFSASLLPGQDTNPAPNILVILADDLGYGDLGFTGCRDIRTPNIDRLAARGVFCTDGHVAASVCAPSRCGLLTGLAPARQGFEANRDMLSPTSHTVAKVLRDSGYTTLGVGKWHMGPDPLSMGFDHFTGLAGGGRSYHPSAKTGKDGRILRDGRDAETEGWTYLTDFMTEEGMRLVKQRDASKPFFLYMSYTTPHTPLEPRADLFEKYAAIPRTARRNYAAMVASLDEEVGQWLDFLEHENLEHRTIILFLSDNGGATINASDNGPWRGMKGSYWEGGQRVPFILSWPGKLKPGRYDKAVTILDLLPTVLGASGKSCPQPNDGVNLLPYLTGSDSGTPHETLHWRYGPVSALREKDLMLIRTREEDGILHAITLFDLSADPGQTRDLAATRPDDVKRLTASIDQWEKDLPAPRGLDAIEYRDNLRRKHAMNVIGRDAERELP